MAEGKEKLTITSDYFDKATGKLVKAGATIEATAERKAELERARVIGGRKVETAERKPRRTAAAAMKEREKATRKPAEER